MLLKIVIKNLQNHYCVSRGYPVTQFQVLNSLAHRSIGNKFQKNFKLQKIEIHSIKMLKAIQLLPSNYLKTYYQTLNDVT